MPINQAVIVATLLVAYYRIVGVFCNTRADRELRAESVPHRSEVEFMHGIIKVSSPTGKLAAILKSIAWKGPWKRVHGAYCDESHCCNQITNGEI